MVPSGMAAEGKGWHEVHFIPLFGSNCDASGQFSLVSFGIALFEVT
jgi:hypothetical protein